MMSFSDDELMMYMSENHGRNLFHLSELATIASLPSLMGKRDAGESFEAVIGGRREGRGLVQRLPLRRPYSIAR